MVVLRYVVLRYVVLRYKGTAAQWCYYNALLFGREFYEPFWFLGSYTMETKVIDMKMGENTLVIVCDGLIKNFLDNVTWFKDTGIEIKKTPIFILISWDTLSKF